MERILTNLVANALRHGASPVTVEVDVATDAETDRGGAGPVVRIRDHGSGCPVVPIRDHGPGFPPELLAVVTASGQARLLGARPTFHNHPDGGDGGDPASAYCFSIPRFNWCSSLASSATSRGSHCAN
ncbi:ATP-binding protein [Streptomyces sp. R28]|uniref:ATP-binding protein n=1 Tax=Streptomyces sp. R28 TaxID=3238628 RepID=A0AB39Q4G0_9ACTN